MHEPRQHGIGDDWLAPLVSAVNERTDRRGVLVALPEYRPDLARLIAHTLGLQFYDYREQVMSKMGWEAGSLTLDQLDTTLADRASRGGIVAFNVESLLATKTREARCRWFEQFTSSSYGNTVLVPLCIFGDDAAEISSQVCHLGPEGLPPQSLLSRFVM